MAQGGAALVFLFDVDNTLLDNDAIQADLGEHLRREFGAQSCARYWEIFEQLRGRARLRGLPRRAATLPAR